MLTVPLVVALGLIAWLMIKKGGWKFGAVGLGFLLGMTLAATPLGPELTSAINQVIDAITGAIADAFRGLQ